MSMRIKETRDDNVHKEATESTEVPLKETFEQSAEQGGDFLAPRILPGKNSHFLATNTHDSISCGCSNAPCAWQHTFLNDYEIRHYARQI